MSLSASTFNLETTRFFFRFLVLLHNFFLFKLQRQLLIENLKRKHFSVDLLSSLLFPSSSYDFFFASSSIIYRATLVFEIKEESKKTGNGKSGNVYTNNNNGWFGMCIISRSNYIPSPSLSSFLKVFIPF